MGKVRHTRRTRARLLESFAQTGRVDLAAAAAGVSRDTHYEWLKEDPAYKAAFESAREQAADLLEAEAWRRAGEGVTEPVFHAGKRAVDFILDDKGEPLMKDGKPVARPAVIRKYSDQLLMFLLKGRKRDVYGDKVEATGKDGSPLFPLDAVRAYMDTVPDDEE